MFWWLREHFSCTVVNEFRNVLLSEYLFSNSRFDMRAFLQTLAVIHTIDTINDSDFLPGIRLGYIICDTCADASKAIQNTLHLLAINSSMTVQCDFTENPMVKAIIGARFSEVSIAVAPLIGIYMVPQVSINNLTWYLTMKGRQIKINVTLMYLYKRCNNKVPLEP